MTTEQLIINPERLENETSSEYQTRRREVNRKLRQAERGVYPTLFVQHVNPDKNPARKWPRRGFKFPIDG